MLIALNKPFGVLCQFSSEGDRPTLKDFLEVPDVYPAGRLDFDSEGLVLLTDDGALQHAIADPRARLGKRYWVQVEGTPDAALPGRLTQGVPLGDGFSRARTARLIDEPAALWSRDPPIRSRQHIPTAWLEVVLTEGKNRQVRRTTAALGHPTLRLVRVAVGAVSLETLGLAPGQWQRIDPALLQLPPMRRARHDLTGRRQPPGRSHR
jgi:23S rRNA pseudouridine2457 synthase